MSAREEWLIELDGKVSLIKRKKGRKDVREPIDGKVVLEAFVHVLGQAIDMATRDPAFKEAIKKKAKR